MLSKQAESEIARIRSQRDVILMDWEEAAVSHALKKKTRSAREVWRRIRAGVPVCCPYLWIDSFPKNSSCQPVPALPQAWKCGPQADVVAALLVLVVSR